MTKIELLDMLTKHAKNYRNNAGNILERNRHMHYWHTDPLPIDAIDAILTTFINEVAMGQCVDYALYSNDLKS